MNQQSLIISATSSNEGKTLLTMALLYHFRGKVSPFKIGPDYIDPQFHKKISGEISINLDSFMMNSEQIKWLYNHYAKNTISIIEGVMGFYDGMDRGCSAYDIGKILNIPTLLILNGSGSYITISAVLKGLKEYTKDNTIKGVVLNRLSSKMHFELIKKQIESDFNDILVVGWIQKDIKIIKSSYLGLDLEDMSELEESSKEVLKNIDIDKIIKISQTNVSKIDYYPFENIAKNDKKIAIVRDENFSFIYHDNIELLREIFQKIYFVSSTKDEIIPSCVDVVYIGGGYVENEISYQRIKNSHNFKNSLILHSKSKRIYAECAGLLYLSNRVDDKIMSQILNLNFTLKDKRSRLGYYFADNLKGHAFHYTSPINPPCGVHKLSKKEDQKGEYGSWQKDLVFGTYLHTMFRNNKNLLKEYFGI